MSFLTKEEAAKRLGVHIHTITRYLSEGKLTKYKQFNKIYVSDREVEYLKTPQKVTV